MVDVTSKIGVKTREEVSMKSMVENWRKVFYDQEKEKKGDGISLADAPRATRPATTLPIY